MRPATRLRDRVIALAVVLACVVMPVAAAAQEGEFDRLRNSPDYAPIREQGSRAVWPLTGQTALATEALVARVESIARDSEPGVGVKDLVAVEAQLSAQAQAFRKAYAQSLSTDQEIDALMGEVIDGVPHADPRYLNALAGVSEGLYLAFGKLVQARFLASAPSGIPRYGSTSPPAGVRTVSQTVAAEHLPVYKKTLLELSANLRELLSLEAKK